MSRLVIVPDGPLHRLPFDALVLRDGRRVVERAAVGMAPSARLAGLAPSAPAGATVVAFGDPALLFFNVNTRDDLTQADVLWRRLEFSRQ